MVGRVKIERRPLVLVEAETPEDGLRHSLLVQNAETVKLVGPGDDDGSRGWRAIPVVSGQRLRTCTILPSNEVMATTLQTELRPGDRLLVTRQAAARHTGIPIEEQIVEK